MADNRNHIISRNPNFSARLADFTIRRPAAVNRRRDLAERLAEAQRSPSEIRRLGQNRRTILLPKWPMIRPQSTRKAQMKTILMLIVGLMLAGCGSMENHVRNRDAVDRNRYLVQHNAVDTICACP